MDGPLMIIFTSNLGLSSELVSMLEYVRIWGGYD